MKRTFLLTAVASILSVQAAERAQNIDKNFPMTGTSGRRVQVDNVFGSIEVTGGSGSELRVHIVRTVRYSSDEMLAEADRDVTLETTQSGNSVRLHVAYPDNDCPCHGRRWHEDRDYRVRYDFRVETPPGMELKLSNVDGEVSVRNTSGDFNVNNVNGGIEMADVEGSGDAHTVNGKVKVSFAKNPTAAASFKSINGELEVTFQPGLSADVRLKTFNGEAWTDFDAVGLPAEPATAERSGGRFVFRRDRFTGLRIGNGGPAITFDTLNGNIYVLQRGKKS